jgi:hypothetical protein
MNTKTLCVTITLLATIMGSTGTTIIPIVNAQNNNTSSQSQLQSQNTRHAAGAENKTYILIFGQRIVGNIDNSTKIVSSIVGNNVIKIGEEFLEEISLAPSQQLQEQVNRIINDGLNGSPCGVSLTTQQGQNVSVDCISSGNKLIWYIYPTL